MLSYTNKQFVSKSLAIVLRLQVFHLYNEVSNCYYIPDNLRAKNISVVHGPVHCSLVGLIILTLLLVHIHV